MRVIVINMGMISMVIMVTMVIMIRGTEH